jgi:5-methyltetrahydropteroyltriglutamate--homocysteine methyltransferase
MKLSTDRILTTHVGSLPRPEPLLDLLEAQHQGDGYDPAKLTDATAKAVAEVVAKQVETGIDVVSDGEVGKISYTFYVQHRLGGLSEDDGTEKPARPATRGMDVAEHPQFLERMAEQGRNWFMRFKEVWCTGPVDYANRGPMEADLANLKSAVDISKPTEAFINAASPGVLTKFVPDAYYLDEDAYVEALAKAMKVEYEAIHQAGFLLQIDCPDLGSARHNQYQALSEKEFLRIADRNVEALNFATENIPPEAMRMHICWGNYEGPHTHDIPLANVFDVCMKGRPSALLFEGANPRHEHEWEDLANANIPDDKVLIPGVIDTITNFVEHPVLVAQRICRYADIVGRERVIAGVDCGFATFAGRNNRIVPSVAWAKLGSLVEGAQIATDRLWK